MKEIKAGNVKSSILILNAAKSYNRQNNLCLKEDSFGKSPIYLVIENHHNDIFKSMIEHGVSVDGELEGTNGFRVCHAVAAKGSVDMVNTLVKYKADINIVDDDQMTPLAFAIQHDQLDIATSLLKHGCDVTMKDKHDNSPVHYYLNGTIYVTERHMGILECLVKRSENNGIFSPSSTVKPLHLAVTHIKDECVLQVVRMLLKNGCGPDTIDSRGAAVLHYICGYSTREYHCSDMNPPSRYKLVKLLIESGASLNIVVEDDFNTALHYATKHGHVKLAELLVQGGANKLVCNMHGLTALDLSPSNANKVMSRVFVGSEKVKKELDFSDMGDALPLNNSESGALDTACRITGRKAGQEWKDLYRELMQKFKLDEVEIHILEIEKQSPGQLREQAYQAMMKWRRQCGEKATLKVLKTALKDCEMKHILDSLHD